MKGKVPVQGAVPELCVGFSETALQLVAKEARKKVENNIRLNFYGNFDAGDLRRHVKETDDCQRILHDSNNDELAEEVFKKEIVKTGSGASVSGAALYGKDVVGVFAETDGDAACRNTCLSAPKMFRKKQSILLVHCTARREKWRCERW